jgi:hypothetical protein
MYCCSGYQTTSDQGGTRFYSSFQPFRNRKLFSVFRATWETLTLIGFNHLVDDEFFLKKWFRGGEVM